MLSHDEKTIIAQCTPKGSGAIAMIRLSGNNAIIIVDQMIKLSSGAKLTDLESHTVHYANILDGKSNIIDNVMIILMKGPKTFTGEDVVEITSHNNPFIIEQIITQAISLGARLAQQGEFAKRAFLNGKIDILQAEAINELINSHTQQAIKKSLMQVQGSFSNWIEQLEKKLIKCLALCDASFEFIDDEIEFGPQILQEIQDIINQIQINKTAFNNQQQIKEGVRIAIIGSVNAGKSSLFNALLKKNRAIVSEIAGTTRDSIEAGIYEQDHYLTIVDTAGLRQTEDVIEQEGIKRSKEEAQKADIILLCIDGSRQITSQEKEVYSNIIDIFFPKIISIINKSDLIKQNCNFIEIIKDFENKINISTKTNLNIDLLEQKIKHKINEIFQKCDSPFLLNKRQFNLLSDLENKLSDIEKILEGKIEYEILSIHINEALQSISELSGKTISEKGMDAIFKEFCIGK